MRGQQVKQSNRWGSAAAVLLFLLPLLAPAASADHPRRRARVSHELRERLRAAAPDDLVPIIIQTREHPSSSHLARLHGRGGAVKIHHQAIRGYSATLPASQVLALGEDPEVEGISYDTPVYASLDVASRAVRADVAFLESGGLDGAGIGIAVIDTGAHPHRDLMRRQRDRWPLEVEIVGHERGLADYYGHGTHVAGVINGNGTASSGGNSFRTFKGLAPGARLISIRALASDGTGRTSDVIAAIDWAIHHRLTYNIRVLNLSLGHPITESYTTDPLCRAARAAVEAGIVVVVSAGNGGRVGSGFATITSPGNEPSVITVGAMDDGDTVAREDDILAPYSSRGPTLIDHVVKPDIVAPGTWIVSLRAPDSFLDTQYHGGVLKVGDYRSLRRATERDGAYYVLSGTSMAAPMVTATVALMLQKDPTLSPASVKARLMMSATTDDLSAFETGAGYLDVAAALEASGTAASAMSPLAVLQPDGTVTFQETAVTWGPAWSQGLVWGGGSRIAATAASTENDQLTASGLVWGGQGARSIKAYGTLESLGLVWGGGRRASQ